MRMVDMGYGVYVTWIRGEVFSLYPSIDMSILPSRKSKYHFSNHITSQVINTSTASSNVYACQICHY